MMCCRHPLFDRIISPASLPDPVSVNSLAGQLWATFPGGFTTPLRPKSASEFEQQGYRRAHQGLHILRDKITFEVKRQELLDSHNPILLEAEKAAKEAKKDAKASKKKKK